MVLGAQSALNLRPGLSDAVGAPTALVECAAPELRAIESNWPKTKSHALCKHAGLVFQQRWEGWRRAAAYVELKSSDSPWRNAGTSRKSSSQLPDEVFESSRISSGFGRLGLSAVRVEHRRLERHSCAPWAGPTRPNPALDALIAIFSADSGPLRAGESGRDGPSERASAAYPDRQAALPRS